MKTIGVLGGLGPQATMDFEARIHTVSQQLTLQKTNPPTHQWWCIIIDTHHSS